MKDNLGIIGLLIIMFIIVTFQIVNLTKEQTNNDSLYKIYYIQAVIDTEKYIQANNEFLGIEQVDSLFSIANIKYKSLQ